MTGKRFTENQITFAPRQAEGGTRVIDVCGQLGVSEESFYLRQKKYGKLGVTEIRAMHQLRDERLNVMQFDAMEGASGKIEAWRIDYDDHRFHSSLGQLTPKEQAQKRLEKRGNVPTCWRLHEHAIYARGGRAWALGGKHGGARI